MYQIPDLQKLYDAPYSEDTLAWRRLGAIDKASHIAELLGAELASSDRVLEVGCGTGDVSAILAGQYQNTQFHGVEIGVARTKRDQRFAGLGNLQVGGYDGAELPFDDRSFDIVFATHVIEHVVNERVFLHELRRVSRDLVLVEAPCEQVTFHSVARIQRTLDIGHINCYTPNSLALLLETSGLEVREYRLFDPSLQSQRFRGGKLAPIKFLMRRGLLRLNPALAAKVFAYHVAVVARRSNTLTIR